MTTPVAGVALDSESVKLLRAGDVLICNGFVDRQAFREIRNGQIFCEDRCFGPFDRFVFVSRPDVPALTDGEGEPWEAAAEKLCAAMVEGAPKAVKRLSEDLYERLMYDVQEYLSDNVRYNIQQQIDSANRQALHDRQRATDLEAQASAYKERVEALEKALDRQCDNMAFVLNRVDLRGWTAKFSTELATDRALLNGADR